MNIEDIKGYIEKAIANNACSEAIGILSNLKTIEDVLNHPKAPEWAYWYAKYAIQGRWPEAEDVIKSSPEWAYWYANDVIKGRWL